MIGVDPAIVPSDQFDPECLPPIEATDLLSYLVLDTSYYTYKSLEAYNQMTSGFVASVQGKLITEKYVVRHHIYPELQIFSTELHELFP